MGRGARQAGGGRLAADSSVFAGAGRTLRARLVAAQALVAQLDAVVGEHERAVRDLEGALERAAAASAAANAAASPSSESSRRCGDFT